MQVLGLLCAIAPRFQVTASIPTSDARNSVLSSSGRSGIQGTSGTLGSARSSRIALRGDLLDFVSDPVWGQTDSSAVRWRPSHWLLIEDGRIAGVQAHEPEPGWTRFDYANSLILPGFIDTHVHSPQLPVIASYGTELLDWLERYTFPTEARHADAAHARTMAEHFIDQLLLHGTTSALVFPTVHRTSVDALFESAQARGMRLITGKVLMDRNAPVELRDEWGQAEKDCRELIEQWHGRGRLAYALTPRFAPTSTPEQLAMAGQLCREDASLYLQTHVAENRQEVQWVRELFPHSRSYLSVYDDAGLLHRRSVLAHGIWLDDEDRQLLATRGASIAHSPTSNLFLGSGLFDWKACEQARVRTAVASDVGGGTSLSMQRNLAAAYQIQALLGQRLTAWTALHAATRGAASALDLSGEIGALEVGCTADVCVWDWAGTDLARLRDEACQSLHERVFAWMMMSDERNLRACYVAGRHQGV